MAITSIKTGSSFTNLVKYNDFLGPNPAFNPSSYESIASYSPTSGTSVTFSSISGSYSHLQIRYNIKTSDNGSFILMRINGATGSVYSQHYLNGDGSSATAGGTSALNTISRLQFPNGTSPTYPNVSIIDLHNYTSTTQNKTVRWFSGQDGNGSGEVVLGSAAYLATTAITSIEIYGITYQSGTNISLYGIKG
jgi:hypothetical protein